VYLTYPGLAASTLIAESPQAAALARAYSERFGELPDSNSPFYGVAAMQVVLAAIEKSDGTRAGVTEAVFGEGGIKIPAQSSVLGRGISIDPKTGDVDNRDITIARIDRERESVITTWPKK
jgi:branched-chain amino acid transport system substrate-binding protein